MTIPLWYSSLIAALAAVSVACWAGAACWGVAALARRGTPSR